MRRFTLAIALVLLVTCFVPSAAFAGKTVAPGVVTGTITDEVFGGPVAAATATAYTYARKTGWSPVANATADANGVYRLSLSPATYRVGFAKSPAYDAEFYSNAATAAAGTDVVVASGKTTPISAALRPHQDGSATYPYLVYDLASLDALRAYAGTPVLCRQVRDIDASQTAKPGSPYNNGGAGWTPLSGNHLWSGEYDGQGHTIANLYSNQGAGASLFGTIGTVSVHDLTMTNVNITSSGGNAAALMHDSDYYGRPTITNVRVTGAVRGYAFVGGLCGIMWYCPYVNHCSFSGTVGSIETAPNYCAIMGGIVGWGWYPTVSASSFNGSILGNGGLDVAGGMIGQVYGGSVYYCYSTGTIQATMAGGITGNISSNYSQTISRSYTAASIGGSSSGPIVGYLYDGATATCVNTYYDSDKVGVADNGFGVGQSTSAMQDPTTFAGWDFAGVWNPPVPGVSYPTLR